MINGLHGSKERHSRARLVHPPLQQIKQTGLADPEDLSDRACPEVDIRNWAAVGVGLEQGVYHFG